MGLTHPLSFHPKGAIIMNLLFLAIFLVSCTHIPSQKVHSESPIKEQMKKEHHPWGA